MSTNVRTKTYADTFIFSVADGSTDHELQKAIVEFVHEADRIIPVDPSFKAVADQIKLRQTTTVLYKILMRRDIVLCSYKKEMPATMKVFAAKDIKLDKKRRIFIDCTNLIHMENGYWVCNEIDKLCSYLFGAMINLLYHANTDKITSNSSIVKSSTQCFIKMFTGILNNLRTINFAENRLKISYICAVYYLYSVMGKDINYARSAAVGAMKLSPRESQAYDIYYDADKDFINIDTFIKCITNTFNLKDMTTDVYINRWSFVYGKGTMYGTEYLPAFLDILAYAFVGAYLNNQKSIETMCRSDMVECATTLLKVGSDTLNSGEKLTLETALQNRVTEKSYLSEAQIDIILEGDSVGLKLARNAVVFGMSRPASALATVAVVKKEVKQILNSTDTVTEKRSRLTKLRTGLRKGAAYRMKHGNIVPVVDKALKKSLYDKVDKICTDAIESLVESVDIPQPKFVQSWD